VSSPCPAAALLPAASVQAHHAEIMRLMASIEMLGNEAMVTALSLADEAADADARGLFMRAQEVRAWVQTTLDMVNTDALCPDLAGQLAYQGVEQAARLVAARETLPR
ncbi:MAG: hypothetical protein Q8M64_04970, partial [Methyloversatilis sp.]|nr:hypothetical protein [Methyloversatilis sp.]